MTLKLDTPCIGVCSTVYGDKICRGCKRRFDEVINWLSYSQEEKQRVYDRLNDHMVTIVGRYITVKDPALVRALLDRYAIRYREDQDPLTWALHLIMFAGKRFTQASEVGLQIHAPHDTLAIEQLCNMIDKELYLHSQ